MHIHWHTGYDHRMDGDMRSESQQHLSSLQRAIQIASAQGRDTTNLEALKESMIKAIVRYEALHGLRQWVITNEREWGTERDG